LVLSCLGVSVGVVVLVGKKEKGWGFCCTTTALRE